MKARTIFTTGLFGLALSLGACDSGEKAGKDGKAKTADAKGAKADAKGADAKGADAKGADAKGADAKGAEAAGGDVKTEAVADADAVDPRVTKAAAIAKKIEAAPEKADEILAEAGMDRESLKALMLEISKGDMAEDYRLAMAEDG